MLDLETLGRTPSAVITQIGAVMIDQHTKETQVFNMHVSIDSCLESGRTIDGGTVVWWLGQSESARTRFVEGQKNAEHINVVLFAFREFMRAGRGPDDHPPFIWGNGVAFDNVILQHAFRTNAMISDPWPYWTDQCYRTLKTQYPHIKLVRHGVHHDAVDDALSQAYHLVDILNFIDQTAPKTREPL